MNRPRGVPEGTVQCAFFKMCLFAEVLKDILRDFLPAEPTLNDPETFESELKMLHRAIMSLSNVIHMPLESLIALGLRTTNSAWEELPQTSAAAVEEVQRVLRAMVPFVSANKALVIPQVYRRLLRRELYEVMGDLENFYVALEHGFHVGEENQEVGMDIVQGANEEQINGMPIYVATEEDTDKECSICIENFAVGEDMKILPCSHQFHKKCIEPWLRKCATCPADRSIVFSD